MIRPQVWPLCRKPQYWLYNGMISHLEPFIAATISLVSNCYRILPSLSYGLAWHFTNSRFRIPPHLLVVHCVVRMRPPVKIKRRVYPEIANYLHSNQSRNVVEDEMRCSISRIYTINAIRTAGNAYLYYLVHVYTSTSIWVSWIRTAPIFCWFSRLDHVERTTCPV